MTMLEAGKLHMTEEVGAEKRRGERKRKKRPVMVS